MTAIDALDMTIVVGVDGSAASEHALRWAIDEARRRSAPLRLVHGWTYAIGGHVAVSETYALLASACQSLLDRVVALARSEAPDLVIDGCLVQRAATVALLESSADADMLVVGSRGHGGFSSLFVGSVADSCVRHARVPVAVVRPEATEHAGGPVVVGVDGSEASLDALRWARNEAAIRDAPLTVLCAWHGEYSTELHAMAGLSDEAERERQARAILADAVDATATSDGKEPQTVAMRDVAAGALVDASTYASLLVVGSRGRGGFAGLLLGSVSRSCVHAAHCPLVVVHGPAS